MLLMLAGAVAELVTIGAVIPFIALLADPARAYEFEFLQRVFLALGWNQPESLALPMTVLFVGIVTTSGALRLLLLWAKNRFVFGMGYDISVQLYGKVLAQPYRWHIARNTSSTIAVVNKVQMVVNGVLQPIMEAIIGMVTGSAIIVLLLVIEPVVAVSATLIFATFYLTVVRLMRLRLRRNGTIIAQAQTERVKAVQEGLGGIRDVLLDGSQPYYEAHFAKVDQRLRKAQATNNFIGGSPRFIIEPLGISLIVALAFFLASTPSGLTAALPTLGALALGAQRLLPLLQQFYNGWSRIMGNRRMFVDVLEHLNLTNNRVSRKTDQPLPFIDAIRLDDVRFQYDSDAPWVINGIDLTIPRGTRIGLAGSTGSGKTTLMDILMGLLEPVEGRMTVDGVSIVEENRRAWQQRVAHVPQFIYLADASIAENIAFGVTREKIDMDRVREAARRAHIADFIEAREEAYEARVGERGIQLSGGQRQRIGIARALYKNAEVLVFDEATSALDDETESNVMRAITGLGKELTVIIIAHRLSTLDSCDEILVVDQGKIVRRGSFDELFGSEAATSQYQQMREENTSEAAAGTAR
jgi:ABC-type multidrug transport system fused ATPase/permease subunit